MSNNNHQELIKHGDRLTARARRWMIWERFAPVFALAALLFAIFIAGSFGGIWQRIGDPWRLIALLIAIFFLVRAALAAWKLSVPSQSDAQRRVEHDSGVQHRPLQVLKDKPAGLTTEPNTAWNSHIARAMESAGNLTPANPIPVIAPRDRYFLRFLMPIILVLAALVGFGDNFERLRSSLSPTWQTGINPAKVTFDAWVDPPNYTGRPPVYFKGKNKAQIPAGSELVARITGVKDAPRLKITAKGRSKYLSLKRLGPQSFEARTTLKTDSKVQWRIGTLTKSWTVDVIADKAPTLEINTPAKADKRDRLAMTYSFKDDYGVVDLTLSMRLLTTPADAASEGDYLKVQVPLPSTSVRRAEKRDSALDMTKHEWTGRKVAGRLIATDGLGQSVRSAEMLFTIPDKIFVEPMAKAIIEHRNLLLSAKGDYAPKPRRTRSEWDDMPIFDNWQTDDRMGRAPAPVQRTAMLIDALTDRPEGLFEDPALYMGLRYVSSRLRQARASKELEGLPDYLWELAIRAEFGVLGTALEEMREAEEALNEGIARRAEQREIDTLFERYDVAVERYLEELRENAEVVDEDGGGGGDGKNIDEIEALLKAIEEANRIGDTEGARKALQQLAALLENMNMQLTKGGSGGEGGQEGEMSEEMEESLEDLADLLGKQRELKDETQQAENNKQQNSEAQPQAGGQQSGSEAGPEDNTGENSQGNSATPEENENGSSGDMPSQDDLARTQQQLAELLEQAQKGLPEESRGQSGNTGQNSENSAGSGNGDENSKSDSPAGGGHEGHDETISPDEALDQAARAMAEAEEAINSGDLTEAAKAQAEAIQALREAAQSLAQQVGNRGEGNNKTGQGANNPLGEENNGEPNENSKADIDQRDNATRSRELLEELRRRAAEQERDQIERDYLERLLKRF